MKYATRSRDKREKTRERVRSFSRERSEETRGPIHGDARERTSAILHPEYAPRDAEAAIGTVVEATRHPRGRISLTFASARNRRHPFEPRARANDRARSLRVRHNLTLDRARAASGTCRREGRGRLDRDRGARRRSKNQRPGARRATHGEAAARPQSPRTRLLPRRNT